MREPPYVCVGFLGGRPRRIEAAAEVGDRARPIITWPILRPQRLWHRGPGFKRPKIGADRDAWLLPAESGFGWLKPHLKRLRGDSAHMGGHFPPFGSIVDEFVGDDGNHPERHCKHHVVEILAAMKDPCVSMSLRSPKC